MAKSIMSNMLALLLSVLGHNKFLGKSSGVERVRQYTTCENDCTYSSVESTEGLEDKLVIEPKKDQIVTYIVLVPLFCLMIGCETDHRHHKPGHSYSAQ